MSWPARAKTSPVFRRPATAQDAASSLPPWVTVHTMLKLRLPGEEAPEEVSYAGGPTSTHSEHSGLPARSWSRRYCQILWTDRTAQ